LLIAQKLQQTASGYGRQENKKLKQQLELVAGSKYSRANYKLLATSWIAGEARISALVH
jgi:hypothetical protein